MQEARKRRKKINCANKFEINPNQRYLRANELTAVQTTTNFIQFVSKFAIQHFYT